MYVVVRNLECILDQFHVHIYRYKIMFYLKIAEHSDYDIL